MTPKRFRSFVTDLTEIVAHQQTVPWSKFETIDPLRPTIILISGFAAGARKLSIMRRRLLRDGFNVVVLSLAWESPWDLGKGLCRMAEFSLNFCLALVECHMFTRKKYPSGNSDKNIECGNNPCRVDNTKLRYEEECRQQDPDSCAKRV